MREKQVTPLNGWGMLLVMGVVLCGSAVLFLSGLERDRGPFVLLGPLGVAGFLLLVAGILWRMLLYRRDVVLVFEPGVVRIGGRADFNPGRFREELRALRELLAAGSLDRPEQSP